MNKSNLNGASCASAFGFIAKHFRIGLTALAMVSAVAFAPTSSAAFTYDNDFESFAGGDIPGFAIGYNVTNSAVGPIPSWFRGVGAPGDYNNGYSRVVPGEGGPVQGNNVLSIFTDVNSMWSPFLNWGPGTELESYVYNDIGTITAGDVDLTYRFSFDTKKGNIKDGTMDPHAWAYVSVLKQSDSSYGEIFNGLLETTTVPTGPLWYNDGFVEVTIDAGMVGELLQFGFKTQATDWDASGVFYDNLNFGATAVPLPAAAWLFGSGLIGLVGIARRKKAV